MIKNTLLLATIALMVGCTKEPLVEPTSSNNDTPPTKDFRFNIETNGLFLSFDVSNGLTQTQDTLLTSEHVIYESLDFGNTLVLKIDGLSTSCAVACEVLIDGRSEGFVYDDDDGVNDGKLEYTYTYE